MKPKNRYIIRARITEGVFRQFLKLFSLDLEATKISKITGLNRNTVNRYARLIRERMMEDCERQSPFGGEVEVDESYFGPRRVRGKRGRGASGKTMVFGVFKRNGKVYTEIVPDVKKRSLQAIIRGRVDVGSIIHSDGWRGYDGLVDVGYECIMARVSSFAAGHTSTALRLSGASPKSGCTVSKVFTNRHSICI